MLCLLSYLVHMFFHQSIFLLLILFLLKICNFEVFQHSMFYFIGRSSPTFREINYLLSYKLGKRTFILIFIYKNKEVGSLSLVKD